MPINLSPMARIATVPGRLGEADVPTPAPCLLTVRGQIPNLPRELLASTLSAADPPLLLQCSLVDWFCLNSNQGLLGAEVLEETGGLADFASLPACITLLSVRSAHSAEFVTATPGRALSISTDSATHRPTISPSQVVALQNALGTHLFEAPSDSPFLHAPSKRAVPRSVQRATALLDETLEELRKSKKALSRRLVVPVQGGIDLEQRKVSARCARDRCEANPGLIAGFTVAGLFAGESPSERRESVRAVTEILPKWPLKILAGHGGAPCEVLDAVANGIDIVETAYPFDVAAEGYALDIKNGLKRNLRDRRFERDPAPLIAGCGCLACGVGDKTHGFYSRAYVRHLLEVHEMLGETLLVAHNLRNYLDWFADLRQAILKGEFDRFRSDFYRVREEIRTTAQLHGG